MTQGNGNNGVTKPITETVRALSGAPMLLALIVLNVLILGMVTYLLHARAEHLRLERTEMMNALADCMGRLNGKEMH